jgi:hypothetical protein
VAEDEERESGEVEERVESECGPKLRVPSRRRLLRRNLRQPLVSVQLVSAAGESVDSGSLLMRREPVVEGEEEEGVDQRSRLR